MLVAIGVSWLQFSRARALNEQRRQQEPKAFLQAIHAELGNPRNEYKVHVGKGLGDRRDLTPFIMIWPATTDALTIYNDHSAFAGKIEDAES
ncbi:hypothetical protein [Burkholderia sp. L27(2015)]|uniref:hypothetical protein n=1 Tax=Burkholderia sp. L27(2015) TaxID=1641858 RepID=UPI00131C6DF5|nr:hypothetical protein [Burkholderia sp. L27(2015)]